MMGGMLADDTSAMLSARGNTSRHTSNRMLVLKEMPVHPPHRSERSGPHFTCFTSTKVQILTQTLERQSGTSHGAGATGSRRLVVLLRRGEVTVTTGGRRRALCLLLSARRGWARQQLARRSTELSTS